MPSSLLGTLAAAYPSLTSFPALSIPVRHIMLFFSQVNKEHALDVGASVEVRSHDKQHTGGWLKARILQVGLLPSRRKVTFLVAFAHP
jgi:hypothetical protein